MKDPKDTNSITCLFCGKETKGGIFKEKQHQIEKKGNATRCLKCSEEEREELEYMTSKDDKKDNYSSFPKVGGLENIVDINEEEELKEVNLNRKKMIDNRRSDVGDNKKMQSTSKDPIDGFVS